MCPVPRVMVKTIVKRPGNTAYSHSCVDILKAFVSRMLPGMYFL